VFRGGKRWLAGTGVAVAATLGLGLLLLHLPPAQTRARAWVVGWLAREVGLTLQSGTFTYNLLTATVSLTDVQLATAGREDRPFLTARRVTVALSPAIYLGRVVVSDIALDSPRVSLSTDARGVSNLPDSDGTPPSADPLALTVRGLHVSDLGFTLEDVPDGERFSADGIDIALDASPGAGVDGASGPVALTRGIQLRWPDRELDVAPLVARAAFDRHEVTLLDVPVDAVLGRFGLTGRIVRVLDAPALDLQYAGQLDTRAFGRWIDFGFPLDGVADVRGAVYGPLTEMEASGRFDSPRLTVGAESRLTAGGSLLYTSDGRITLSRLVLAPESGGDVALDVDIPPGADEASRTRATFGNVDARVFMRVFETTVLPVAGRLDGEALFAGGEQPGLALQATARRFQSRGATPVSGRARVDIRNGRYTIAHAVQTDGLSAEGRVAGQFDWSDVTRSTLGGLTHLRVVSLAGADRSLQPQGYRVPAAVRGSAGTVQAAITLSGRMASPRVAVDAFSPAIALPGLGDAEVRAQLTADARQVDVTRLSVARGSTVATGQVQVELRREQMRGTLRIEAPMLDEWQPGRDTASTLRGSLTADAVIGGTLEAPAIDVAVQPSDLTLASETLHLAEATLRVRAEDVWLDALRIEQGDGVLEATGRYGLDDTHDWSARVSGLRWQGALVDDVPSEVIADGSFQSHGPVSAPRGDGQFRLRLSGGMVGDLVSEGSATVRLNGREAQVDVDAPALGASIHGAVALMAPYAYTGSVVADRLSLGRIAPLVDALPNALTGLVSFEARTSGVWDDPAAATAALDLRRLEARLNGVTATLRAPARLTWTPEVLAVEGLQVALGQSVVTVSGSQAGQGSGVLAAQYQGTVEDVAQAAAAFGVELPVEATGRLQASLTTTTRPEDLRVSVTVADGTVATEGEGLVDALEARLSLEGEQFRIDGISGQLRVARVTGPFTVTGAGRLPNLNPREATGQFVLERGAFDAGGVAVTQVRPSTVSLTRGIVSMDDVAWEALSTRLYLEGNVDLQPAEPALNLNLSGVAIMRVLSAVLPDVSVDGLADVAVYIGGTPRVPDFAGTITLRAAEFGMQSPRLVATGVTGPIRLSGTRITFDDLRGEANGGQVSLTGEALVTSSGLQQAEVTVVARGVGVEYPVGLRSEVDARLTVRAVGGDVYDLSARGEVHIRRSGYTDPISLAALARAASTSGVQPAPTLIDGMRLDIAVTTDEDIRVDNNYGRFDTGAQVRLVGTYAQPGLSGRATVREGGTLYVAGRSFTLVRGTVSFTNLSRIEPDLDLQAETRLPGQGTVTLTLQGTPQRFSYELQSENGGTDEEIATALFGGAVTGGNALTLLSSDLLGVTGRQMGFDSVRLDRGDVVRDEFREDPSLLFQDNANPVTRLTFSKRVRDTVEFVLSQNLRQNGKTTFVVSYYPRPTLEVRTISRDDGTLGVGVRHDVTFGGTKRTAAPVSRPTLRVASVTIVGDYAPVSDRDLRRRVRLAAGRAFDSYVWQRDLDALRSELVARGYAEARVRGERETRQDGTVEVTYTVARGPETRVEVEGVAVPPRLTADVRDMWSRAVFDRFVVQDAEARVRRLLLSRGQMTGEVTGTMAVDGPVKTVRVTVDPGPASATRERLYDGNVQVGRDALEEVVTRAGLAIDGWADRARLAQTLQQYYRSNGYLAATVTADPPVRQAERVVLPVHIVEGPRALVGDVRWSGVHDARLAEMADAAELRSGDAYTLTAVSRARDRVDREYRLRGFNDVAVTVAAAPGDPGTVDVSLTVTEGLRQVLRRVETRGTARTRDGVVRGALRLHEGEPVNLDEWALARKRVFDTNVFRAVDISAEPDGPPDGGDQPVVAVVTVEEYAPWRLRYGAQADRDREVSGETGRVDSTVGVIAELRNQNVFGRALTAGVATRVERDYQRANTFLQNASFLGLPVRTGLFGAVSRERMRFEGDVVSITDTASLSLEQRWRRRRGWEVTYGYRIETSHTYDPSPSALDFFPLDERATVGQVTAAALIDRRDSPVNATRGTFSSVSLEQAARGLGSDARYGKVFVQQSGFRSWGPVVLAARVLAGTGFGPDELLPVDRFFAGGGTTVRGYAENGLGPFGADGSPSGGRSMLVFNHEARVSLGRWLSALAFVDAGNAFDRAQFSARDLSVGYGLGVRVNSPIGLLRLDFGIPATAPPKSTRRANQLGSGRYYLGFGHIF